MSHRLPNLAAPPGGWEKLPAGFKTQWLEALRSGKYEQGKGSLLLKPYETSDDGRQFCCLGVAAEMMGCEIRKDDDGYPGVMCCTNGEWHGIPDQLIGSDSPGACDDEDSYNPTVRMLVALNDGAHGGEPHSFPEIADWVEENL